MSRVAVIILQLFFLTALVQANPGKKDKEYVVAFAQDTMDNDFRVAQVKEVKETLESYPNIRFLHSNAKASTALMISQIEAFIEMKVDLIMTSPLDETAMAPIIEKAHDSGIPVILIGRSVKTDRYTLFVHPDNAKIARLAAEYMAEKMQGKGTILMLKGVPKTDVTRQRTDAFLEIIRRHKGIRVIEKTANFLRRDTIRVMEKLLEKGEHFDAIYSHSDSMLSGVRLVLKHKGIDPATLLMVGVDYIGEARDAIRNGEQDSTFLYPLSGKEAAMAAVEVLEGKELPKEMILETMHITNGNIDAIEPIF